MSGIKKRKDDYLVDYLKSKLYKKESSQCSLFCVNVICFGFQIFGLCHLMLDELIHTAYKDLVNNLFV